MKQNGKNSVKQKSKNNFLFDMNITQYWCQLFRAFEELPFGNQADKFWPFNKMLCFVVFFISFSLFYALSWFCSFTVYIKEFRFFVNEMFITRNLSNFLLLRFNNFGVKKWQWVDITELGRTRTFHGCGLTTSRCLRSSVVTFTQATWKNLSTLIGNQKR